jgi:hypothetical protein
MRQHSQTAQPKFPRNLKDCLRIADRLSIALSGVARDQTQIIRRSGQDIARAEVTGLDPLIPWRPRRSLQGTVTGQQDDISDAGFAIGSDQQNNPVPALIAGCKTREPVRCAARNLSGDAKVRPDMGLRNSRITRNVVKG